MRFLVTGASGFIGSRLAENLSKRFGKSNVQLILPPLPKHSKEAGRVSKLTSEEFDIVHADLLNPPDHFSQTIKPFDILYHLAAFGETESKEVELNQVNDIGTKNLITHLSHHLKNGRIVFTSTLAAVDRSFADNTPQSEDYPCTPRTEYGRSKLNAENIIKSLADEIGFQWVIFRLPTVIGEGYRPGGLADVIANDLKRNGLFTRLNWPGRIELVHVQDVAQILEKSLILNSQSNFLFHLSSGIAPTLDQLIQDISNILQVRRKRINAPSFFWLLIKMIIWIKPLHAILPFSLKVTFWRLSLIVSDGFVGESKLLFKSIPHSFVTLSEMLHQTYKNK